MATRNGTNDDDALYGTADDDTINGLGGADILMGGGGADRLDGGTGIDIATYLDSTIGVTVNLATGRGFDGTADGDTLFNIEYLRGSNHDDWLHGDGGTNDLYGMDGNDFLLGGWGADGLDGGAGDDILQSGGGADYLDGGAGIDTADYSDANGVGVKLFGNAPNPDHTADTLLNIENVTGSRYRDVLEGSSETNLLRGLGGNDLLSGHGGDDTLEGGEGSDELRGDEGDDTLEGGEGSDELRGDEGDDTLGGGEGGDTLDGGIGADTMIGGGHSDTYCVDNAGDVVIEALEGNLDQVRTVVSYTLTAGSEIEILFVNEEDSTNAINLTGNEFDNHINGNNGANVINGGAGADVMTGYGGADIYYVDNAGDIVFGEAAGQGTDSVSTTVSYTLAAGISVETIRVLSAATTGAVNLTGNEFANVIQGNAGSNVLDGKGGDDALSGFGGNDSYRVDNAGDRILNEAAGQGTDSVSTTVSYTLAAGLSAETMMVLDAATTGAVNLTGNEIANIVTGNAGANVINGGAGADSMRGLGGNDTYVVDNVGDRVTEAVNAGTDLITTALSIALGVNVENAILTGGANINGTGNALSNALIGNSGINVLNGGDGIDRLSGAAGNDLLAGGLGKDTLIGGVGKDLFLFNTALNAATNVDTVTDFKVVDDTVRLENAIFTTLTATGTLSADAFHIGAAATDAEDRIIYNSATGALLYDANGIGGTAPIQFAKIDPGLALTNADFFVV